MDIMNNSRILANVARSVTDNMTALALVFYLFVCTVAIYAQFGLEYFEDWFIYDGDADDADSYGCHSVVSCFVLIFYNGVPNGSLGDVMDNISNRHGGNEGQSNNTYIQRVIFDLSFFIWVGILLFNIITGLMVDGFGALREEDNERQDTLENTCFVCGFTRSQYDDVPNFRGPSFDYHKDVDHEFWIYVYFYVYLKRKDKTTFSGVESYVWKQIMDTNLGWIPSRGSAAIQNSNAVAEFESEKEVDPVMIEQMAEDMITIKHALVKVEKTLHKNE
jgi:inositol 1,4,5-triphosphate receptor type 3